MINIEEPVENVNIFETCTNISEMTVSKNKKINNTVKNITEITISKNKR